jgi:hypothetical protein
MRRNAGQPHADMPGAAVTVTARTSPARWPGTASPGRQCDGAAAGERLTGRGGLG